MEPASEQAGLADLPEEHRDLPAFFAEILMELLRHQTALGGLRNFRGHPRIEHKVTRDELVNGYTDFEYVYLTVLGLARLHTCVEEIVQKCNGRVHTQNPGVQLLEATCGMTMHGDRSGAAALLRTAPASLLEAFRLAKALKGGPGRFFRDAFDRRADPCLEGRMARIFEYLERARMQSEGPTGTAPWEDISLKVLAPDAKPNDVVGEHLRVFVNECTWKWAQDRGLEYEVAKARRSGDVHAAEFNRLFNADTFRAAMLARGVVEQPPAAVRQDQVQWEVKTDTSWAPLEAAANDCLERARAEGRDQVELRLGPMGWKYQVDLRRHVQRNPKTGKERPIRLVQAGAGGAAQAPAQSVRGPRRPRQLKREELEAAISLFVELQTLPEGPARAGLSPASTGGTSPSSPPGGSPAGAARPAALPAGGAPWGPLPGLATRPAAAAAGGGGGSSPGDWPESSPRPPAHGSAAGAVQSGRHSAGRPTSAVGLLPDPGASAWPGHWRGASPRTPARAGAAGAGGGGSSRPGC